jgi:predicted acetyltransferase
VSERGSSSSPGYRVRRVRSTEEYRLALGAVAHYFGFEPTEEDIERFGRMMPQERVYAALTQGRIVGGAGSFPIDLTVPGGTVACAAVSIVGVLPSDRRRGVLRRMMDAQLRDARAAGEPLAALWASEETIYGRFGYGLAALSLMIDADRHRVRIAPGPSSEGRVRLVDTDEALQVFPRVYERVRPGAVAHLSRAPAWWEHRRLGDRPDQRRGAGPLNRALLERDGTPVGYALYRISQSGSSPADWKKTVRVIEAVGIDPAATRDIWRFLFEIDWTDRVEAFSIPLDHPLLLLADRLTELGATVWDGLWLRLLDVDAALRGRAYGAGRATVEVVADGLFPENVGRWTIADGAARRSRSRPDVQLPVEALGAVYLGGFSVRELVRAGRAVEVIRGGAAKLDAVLGGWPYPWCPEVF